MLVTSNQQNANCLNTPDRHEIPFVSDALFGCIIGRDLNIYTDKEGLAAKVVHVLVEHVILNRTISSSIICRSSRTTKSIRSKCLTLSIEPPVTDEIVLVEQCTTWSEEAVLGQTSSSISCANMKCLAFILWVSIATFINLTITDKSSIKSEHFQCHYRLGFHWCRVLGISKFLLCEDH